MKFNETTENEFDEYHQIRYGASWKFWVGQIYEDEFGRKWKVLDMRVYPESEKNLHAGWILIKKKFGFTHYVAFIRKEQDSAYFYHRRNGERINVYADRCCGR